MSEAIFGLVGVIVGALITGAGDYILERRRERRNVRKAARLLHLELEEAVDFIERSLGQSEWISSPERVLSNQVWIEYRTDFAAVDDKDRWKAVSEGFLAIAEIRRANLVSAGTPLNPGDRRFGDAQERLQKIRPGLAALAPY